MEIINKIITEITNIENAETYEEKLNQLLEIVKDINANKKVSPDMLINKILTFILKNYDIKYTQVIISTLRHNQIINYKNKELVKYFAQIYNLLGKYHVINYFVYKGITIQYNTYFLEEVISNGSENIKELCITRQTKINNNQKKGRR